MQKITIFFILILFSCVQYQKKDIDFSKWGYKFTKIEERTIHYNVIGKGKPVLFLHGFASYLHIWILTAESLKSDFESILVDLPGFGLSDRKKDAYNPSRVAELVYQAVKNAGYNKISIAGHSWGGAVALAMAFKHPDFIDKLIIVDGWIYPEQEYSFFDWARKPLIGEMIFGLFYREQTEYRYAMGFYKPEKWLDYTLVTTLGESYKIPGTEAASLAVARGLDELENMSKNYNKISHKTLVVWCEDDPVADVFFGKRLSNEIHGAELKIMNQCGHFPMIEQTQKFAEILRNFLQ